MLRFNFASPPQPQVSPAIIFSVVSPVAIAPIALRPSDDDAQGVPGGARPIFVIAPALVPVRKDAARAAYLTAAVNTITLQADFAGAAVALGSFAGSATRRGKLTVRTVGFLHVGEEKLKENC